MNGEYMSLETAKRIKQLEKEIANLNNDATHLLELHKKDKERIDKAIEYIDGIFKNGWTDDWDIMRDLREILKDSDKE